MKWSNVPEYQEFIEATANANYALAREYLKKCLVIGQSAAVPRTFGHLTANPKTHSEEPRDELTLFRAHYIRRHNRRGARCGT